MPTDQCCTSKLTLGLSFTYERVSRNDLVPQIQLEPPTQGR
jgi:hypothetical protein